MTGVDMLYVPYKGEGPAIIDLVAGQISLIFSNVVAVLPQVTAYDALHRHVPAAMHRDLPKRLVALSSS